MFEFELSVLLREKTDPMRPLVFQAMHRRPRVKERATAAHAVVLEENSVSNGIVWKLEERLVVRQWDLQERAKVWILHSDPLANPAMIGIVLKQIRSISFAD